MNAALRTTASLLLFFFAVQASRADGPEELKRDFADPPLRCAPRPLWFWNDTVVTEQGVAEQMQHARDKCGYGGFGILPFGKAFRPEYLTEDYFRVYGAALQKAKELGMTMCIYDEYGYPSGSAGAIHGDGRPRFAEKHPDSTIKRLDKHEQDVTGPAALAAVMPEGRVMSVVAMNVDSKQRIDLAGEVRDGQLAWRVPAGDWKLMWFVCVKDGDPNVDYLDPEAVKRFVAMTHQQYYDRFKEHFGTTIDGTFFDEPTMYRAKGRMWTDAFNEKFKARHGFDPAPWYPALWYDVGPETEAARNYLFGFRTELYARGFPNVIQDWCDEHGIAATGHQDQEEVVNPVSVSGDLMKCFKHQDIPGVDKIGGARPAERFYKVISSAAYNWDKALVMSETYGAMGDIEWETIYHVAMEQYAKGVNQLIPHAVWYDPAGRIYKPELSWRHPKYAGGLPQYNRYMSRLNHMLQNHGRHVADIAVLYPIATLQAGHYLDGELGHYRGGVAIPEADYVDVGELLAVDLGRDYTFLHPEVLDEKCSIQRDALRLNNPINHETYKVVVLPGHKTVAFSNLKKIKAFYDAGGKVIATGTLPHKSAEFGHDADVVRTVETLFPGGRDSAASRNDRGGRAVFLKQPTAETLLATLDAMLDVYDVECEPGKALTYIHKIVDGRHVYFFANLSDKPINAPVRLRGRLRAELWDPHTGKITRPKHVVERRDVVDVTKVDLTLPPTRSIFVVAEASRADDPPERPAFLEPPRVVTTSPGPEYQVESRKFQGIPSLARSANGRLWAVWYASRSGGEDQNNYVVAVTSGDDGATWSEPALVIDPDGKGPVRAFDPQVWLDPDGRLWIFWAQAVGHDGTVAGVWAVTIENPDDAHPRWSEPRRLTDGIMMGKPTVLSDGTWVLPASTWRKTDNSARAVVSTNQGKTWQVRGGCQIPPAMRAFDEHMFVERKDGSLWMLARSNTGSLLESVSTDHGKTWPVARASAIEHPSARFFIRRLASGNLLLVKHHNTTGRKRLTALISEDDGTTWTGGLLLDERGTISYPDGVQADDGRVYIIYDRNRTTDRQILMAVFTEADAAAGKPGEQTRLKVLVNQGTGLGD